MNSDRTATATFADQIQAALDRIRRQAYLLSLERDELAHRFIEDWLQWERELFFLVPERDFE